MTDATPEADGHVPQALQLAVRVEKVNPPTTVAICRAVALATVGLLDDERGRPGGVWHQEIETWNGAQIRKIVRRGRGATWQRAQEARGLTVVVGGVEVRAFVPGPMNQVPDVVAKLQIQSSPLDEPERIGRLPDVAGLVIAVTPEVEMSWGKQAAQCAHAAQRAWMTGTEDVVRRWDGAGRPLTVVHPEPSLWPSLVEAATTQINDGGFTEIPAGTLTTVAWWVRQRGAARSLAGPTEVGL